MTHLLLYGWIRKPLSHRRSSRYAFILKTTTVQPPAPLFPVSMAFSKEISPSSPLFWTQARLSAVTPPVFHKESNALWDCGFIQVKQKLESHWNSYKMEPNHGMYLLSSIIFQPMQSSQWLMFGWVRPPPRTHTHTPPSNLVLLVMHRTLNSVVTFLYSRIQSLPWDVKPWEIWEDTQAKRQQTQLSWFTVIVGTPVRSKQANRRPT